jgi:hypothetical protein
MNDAVELSEDRRDGGFAGMSRNIGGTPNTPRQADDRRSCTPAC